MVRTLLPQLPLFVISTRKLLHLPLQFYHSQPPSSVTVRALIRGDTGDSAVWISRHHGCPDSGHSPQTQVTDLLTASQLYSEMQHGIHHIARFEGPSCRISVAFCASLSIMIAGTCGGMMHHGRARPLSLQQVTISQPFSTVAPEPYSSPFLLSPLQLLRITDIRAGANAERRYGGLATPQFSSFSTT